VSAHEPAGRVGANELPDVLRKLAKSRGSVCQQLGIPAGRADAFPVELVEPEAPVPVAPDVVEPTVVLGVFSDDDAPAAGGFFSRTMLLQKKSPSP